MEKNIFFDHADIVNLPHYHLGYTAQRYLYFSPLENLIKRHINCRTTKVIWSKPLYFEDASKVVNTLHKTNYNLTVCAYCYDYHSKNKVHIAAFASNLEFDYKTNYPQWFTKE